jgi:hypothetical protein
LSIARISTIDLYENPDPEFENTNSQSMRPARRRSRTAHFSKAGPA